MLTLPSGVLNARNLSMFFPHSDVNLPRGIAVGWERRSDPSYSWYGLQRPDGPNCLFQYTLAGRGVLERGGKRHILAPGKAFLVEIPDDHHYYLPDGWEPWEFAFVLFDGADLLRHVHWVIQQQGSVISLSPDHAAMSNFSEIFSAVHLQQYTDAEALSEALYRFVLGLRRVAGHTVASHRVEIIRALQYAAQHYAEDIGIENLAAASGLSRAHFSRVFHQEMGKSAQEYLTDVRLQRAICLLRGTRLPLEVIAEQCGFAGASYFGKVFRKQFGITPINYREGQAIEGPKPEPVVTSVPATQYPYC